MPGNRTEISILLPSRHCTALFWQRGKQWPDSLRLRQSDPHCYTLMPKHLENCLHLCRSWFSGEIKACCNHLHSVHFTFSFSFNSKSPFVASDTLKNTADLNMRISWFSFHAKSSSFWKSRFQTSPWRWELGSSFCILASKQKFSFDHLSVDTRDTRQRAITGRLMMRLQTLAALCIHSEHCRGMLTSLPAYPSVSHWKC